MPEPSPLPPIPRGPLPTCPILLPYYARAWIDVYQHKLTGSTAIQYVACVHSLLKAINKICDADHNSEKMREFRLVFYPTNQPITPMSVLAGSYYPGVTGSGRRGSPLTCAFHGHRKRFEIQRKLVGRQTAGLTATARPCPCRTQLSSGHGGSERAPVRILRDRQTADIGGFQLGRHRRSRKPERLEVSRYWFRGRSTVARSAHDPPGKALIHRTAPWNGQPVGIGQYTAIPLSEPPPAFLGEPETRKGSA